MVKKPRHSEKLKLVRFLMVISGACLFMVIVPTLFLGLRFYKVKKKRDTRNLIAGISEDHRGHVLVYLFATLLPFYREDLATYRDLAGMLAALAFIIFLF